MAVLLPGKAYAETPKYEFNTPDPITVDGVTASVKFDNPSPQEAGTEVTATIELSGKALEDGIHLLKLFSDTLGGNPCYNYFVVESGEEGSTSTFADFSFSVPNQSINDFTLEHFVITTQYTLCLKNGKGYFSNDENTPVDLRSFNIIATEGSSTYTFNGVNFSTINNIAVNILDDDATIILKDGTENFVNGYAFESNSDISGIKADRNLTFEGGGTLNVQIEIGYWNSCGLRVEEELTVKSGIIKASSGYFINEYRNGSGVVAGSINVLGGSLEGYCNNESYGASGISATKTIFVNGGNIIGDTSKSKSTHENVGIFARDEILIINGTVTGYGGMSNLAVSLGIRTDARIIAYNSKITASSEYGVISAGIYTDDFQLIDSTAKVKSGDGEHSIAIITEGSNLFIGANDVLLSGKSNVSSNIEEASIKVSPPKTWNTGGTNGLEVWVSTDYDSTELTKLQNWKGDGSDEIGEYKTMHFKSNTASKESDDNKSYSKPDPVSYSILPRVNERIIILFDENSDRGSMDFASIKEGESFVLPDCGFTAPEGCEFAGWSFTKNGKVISTKDIMVTKDTRLFAIWKPKTSDNKASKEEEQTKESDNKKDDNKKKTKKVELCSTIPLGEKMTFTITASGYNKKDIVWSTLKKGRAVVGKNKGKLTATVKGKSAGTDTIIIKVKGKKIAEFKVKIVDNLKRNSKQKSKS